MKFLTFVFVSVFLPAITLAADLPPLIPVVSKPVTKDQAISLIKSGGKELRVSREDLANGLKYVIAKHGGHDTGADNPLSDDELVMAMNKSEVVPCDFSKGEVSVFGYRRDEPSKMDGFFRDARPGEMCLSYKGARIVSLGCLNPLWDMKVFKPPVPVATVVPPKPAAVPPAPVCTACQAQAPVPERRVVVVMKFTREYEVQRQGGNISIGITPMMYGNQGFAVMPGGLSNGGGMIFSRNHVRPPTPIAVVPSGLSYGGGQVYSTNTVVPPGNITVGPGGWTGGGQVYSTNTVVPPSPPTVTGGGWDGGGQVYSTNTVVPPGNITVGPGGWTGGGQVYSTNTVIPPGNLSVTTGGLSTGGNLTVTTNTVTPPGNLSVTTSGLSPGGNLSVNTAGNLGVNTGGNLGVITAPSQ